MPEGPEVETIRRGLELGVTGRVIVDVEVLAPKSFPDADDRVIGATVKHLARFGKVLVMELDNGLALMFHLKMTGQLVLAKTDGERFAGGHPTESMAAPLPDRSTRAIFEFEGGDKLYFNDQRRFGWIKLTEISRIGEDALVARLGPEVLSSQFTDEHLAARLQRFGRSPVKAVILDQSTAPGIGNIYADESLHLAKIHPARLSGTLTPAEVKRLHGAMRQIMALGIEHGGTSFSHYVNLLGGKGDYLEHARVFRRQGQPCPVCGNTIEKIRVAGRGTHICLHCQKLPRVRA